MVDELYASIVVNALQPEGYVVGMISTVVFDVNETLLSLVPVRNWFRARFDDGPTAAEWFSELLRLSFVSSVIDVYVPFTDLAAHALTSVATKQAVATTSEDLGIVSAILATLPPHPDAIPGIASLRAAGFSVAALTNSPLAVANTQLEHAGLSNLFDEIMSVEMVRRFKPHRSVYLAAAERMGVDPSDTIMVAAHDWDIAGAMSAGLQGVFIERPGQGYSPGLTPPTFRAHDIDEAAGLMSSPTSAG